MGRKQFRSTISTKSIDELWQRLPGEPGTGVLSDSRRTWAYLTGLIAALVGTPLLLASCIFGLFSAWFIGQPQQVWLMLGAAGAWLICLSSTLLSAARGLLAAGQYLALVIAALLGYLSITTSDVHYWNAGVGLFCASMHGEQTATLLREYPAYYRGLRPVTLIASWTCTATSLALVLIYLVPLPYSERLPLVQAVQAGLPPTVIALAYGFLSMLRRGMTPHSGGVAQER